MERTKAFRMAGYHVIEAWSCEVGEEITGPKPSVKLPQAETKSLSYPHAILHDFEAYCDSTQRKDPTSTLTIENAHVPISVTIGDTLEREPTHI